MRNIVVDCIEMANNDGLEMSKLIEIFNGLLKHWAVQHRNS